MSKYTQRQHYLHQDAAGFFKRTNVSGKNRREIPQFNRKVKIRGF